MIMIVLFVNNNSSRSEFITLKSTLESVLSGKPEEAKVLLSKDNSSKKRKKSSSDPDYDPAEHRLGS